MATQEQRVADHHQPRSAEAKEAAPTSPHRMYSMAFTACISRWMELAQMLRAMIVELLHLRIIVNNRI